MVQVRKYHPKLIKSKISVAESVPVLGDCGDLQKVSGNRPEESKNGAMTEETNAEPKPQNVDDKKLGDSKSEVINTKIPYRHINNRNIFKEAKDLESEANTLTPLLTAVEQESKQSDERSIYQLRALKMNFTKCDQEYQKVAEKNAELKKKISHKDYDALRLDLQIALNERIYKHAKARVSRERASVRKQMLEMGKTMSVLWENTKKLADYLMPREQSNAATKATGLTKWLFHDITDTIFNNDSNAPDGKRSISQDEILDGASIIPSNLMVGD